MTAQKVETVRIEGQVVKVEHSKGAFTGSDGSDIAYDFHEAKILTPDMDISVVRIRKDGPVQIPQKGDTVHYVCDARNSSGNVKLTAERQELYTYAELLEAAAKV